MSKFLTGLFQICLSLTLCQMATQLIFTQNAQAQTMTSVSCKVQGVLNNNSSEWKYKTIVQGRFEFDSTRILKEAPAIDGGCKSIDIGRKIFGAKNRTQLEVVATKCQDKEPYITFKVVSNKLPILAHMEAKPDGRIIFNEGSMSQMDEPLRLPEGEFKYIYADCSRIDTPMTAEAEVLPKSILR